MPLSKIGPNPKTNPKPNPNPNREAVFLEGNCLVAPNPKITLTLTQTPTLTGRQFSSENNCPDTIKGSIWETK